MVLPTQSDIKSGDKTWTRVPSTNFRQDAVARHAQLSLMP